MHISTPLTILALTATTVLSMELRYGTACRCIDPTKQTPTSKLEERTIRFCSALLANATRSWEEKGNSDYVHWNVGPFITKAALDTNGEISYIKSDTAPQVHACFAGPKYSALLKDGKLYWNAGLQQLLVGKGACTEKTTEKDRKESVKCNEVGYLDWIS